MVSSLVARSTTAAQSPRESCFDVSKESRPRTRIARRALILSAAGCGSGGPDMVDVSGTATRNGQPVPNIDIYFQPAEGRPSLGTTDEQGRFKMQYTHDQSGVRVGHHTVYVIYNPADGIGAKRPADLDQIVKKYGRRRSRRSRWKSKHP